MLIKNAHIRGTEGLSDILIKDGKIEKIGADIAASGEEVIDACGNLVSAPYVDTHCHLDYVGTAVTLDPNVSGTLFEAISILKTANGKFTKDEYYKAAEKALKWQIANGTQFVRTHCNTDAPDTVALEALLELKEKYKEYVTLQIVAFPQYTVMHYPDGLAKVEKALQMGVDCVGAIPHTEHTREQGVESVKEVFKLAKKYDRLVDIHCDEIDDEQSRFIEVLAEETIINGLEGKVTASHTTAMGSYNDAYTYGKLFNFLKEGKINIICNATINTVLQGRFDSYPKRRGLTRVKELLDFGINVSMGSDDIMDSCYPLSTANMMDVLNMGIHVCHLTGQKELIDAFKMVTDNGAITMNIQDQYGIEEGKPGNLIILPAKDEADAVRKMVAPLYSIRNGKVIAESKPREVSLHLLEDSIEDFNFEV